MPDPDTTLWIKLPGDRWMRCALRVESATQGIDPCGDIHGPPAVHTEKPTVKDLVAAFPALAQTAPARRITLSNPIT